ncbi:hypothetical protein [uncultured Clostridium sp.]|uniref:hypothetical protein n=1 Tax=uncultured Clostridium sp. TaxID=59620 RepID=UPI002582DC0F|nr:hypothetical protein [uncultured Clostridium sp.]
MIIKKIFIGLIIITLSTAIGCSNSIFKEDKVIDSIIIDDDANETANSNNILKVTKVLKTENLSGNKNGALIRNDDRLIEINYHSEREGEEEAIYSSQFPKIYIDSLYIGNITDVLDNDRNIINWDNKEISGQLLVDYMGASENFRILKDNKVYILDEDCSLKELTAYKKLIEDTKGNLNRFQISDDGKLDIYFFDEGSGIEKISIIDTVKDKYYELTGSIIDIIKNNFKSVLMIDGEKIYILLENGSSTTIGYIEDNKFNVILDDKSGIDFWVRGGIIYSNNKILFSGFVEEKYGVWRYDIDTKELTKEIELDYLYSFFKLNKEKDLVLIENSGPQDEKSIGIARINDNLEISNFQDFTNSMVVDDNYKEYMSIKGWSNKENKFYVQYINSKTIDGAITIDDIYYEIYEVK